MKKLIILITLFAVSCQKPTPQIRQMTREEIIEDSIQTVKQQANSERILQNKIKPFRKEIKEAIFEYNRYLNTHLRGLKCRDGEFSYGNYAFFVAGKYEMFMMDKPRVDSLKNPAEKQYLWKMYCDCNLIFSPRQ